MLILDEPTDGLDPNQKHEVRDLIRDMARDKAIILSTHILEEVEAVCTRAIIIAKGRLIVDGTPAELEARSELHNAVTLTLLASTALGALDILQALPGVNRVEVLAEHDGLWRSRIIPENGCSILQTVSHCARERRWEVSELHVERGQLDDVFRSLTVPSQSLT